MSDDGGGVGVKYNQGTAETVPSLISFFINNVQQAPQFGGKITGKTTSVV